MTDASVDAALGPSADPGSQDHSEAVAGADQAVLEQQQHQQQQGIGGAQNNQSLTGDTCHHLTINVSSSMLVSTLSAGQR